MNSHLFDIGHAQKVSPFAVAEKSFSTPRLRIPQRNQVEMHFASLDDMLEMDNPARAVWDAIRPIHGCWLPYGCMPRWTPRVVLARWLACVRSTWPISGSAVVSPLTTTCCRIFVRKAVINGTAC